MTILPHRLPLRALGRPYVLAFTAVGFLGIIMFVASDFYFAIGRARALYEVRVLGESAEGDVAYYLQECRRTVIYSLTSQDPNSQLPYIYEARAADREVDRLVSSVLKMDLDDKTRFEVTEFIAARQVYLKTRDDIISLILTDQRQQALAIDLTRSTPAFDRVSERLRNVKASLDRHSALLSDQVLHALYRSLFEFAALLAISFLFIAAVASNFEKRRALEKLKNVNQELELARSEALGGSLRFEVKDTGIGISDEAKTRLFQVFSQADSSTTRRYAGSGLGLSISEKLVELMGGEIAVDSRPGFGSTFWFSLPLPERFVPPEEECSLDSPRVLVVDDNEIDRKVVRYLLLRRNIKFSEASEGSEARAALRAAVARDIRSILR